MFYIKKKKSKESEPIEDIKKQVANLEKTVIAVSDSNTIMNEVLKSVVFKGDDNDANMDS